MSIKVVIKEALSTRSESDCLKYEALKWLQKIFRANQKKGSHAKGRRRAANAESIPLCEDFGVFSDANHIEECSDQPIDFRKLYCSALGLSC